MAAWEPATMYGMPRPSRTSTRYRSSSACVTQEPPGYLVSDLLGRPLRMPVGEVRGEPVPGQFPGLVPQAQSLHAGHRPERAGDHGIDGLDRHLAIVRHAVMICQE